MERVIGADDAELLAVGEDAGLELLPGRCVGAREQARAGGESGVVLRGFFFGDGGRGRGDGALGGGTLGKAGVRLRPGGMVDVLLGAGRIHWKRRRVQEEVSAELGQRKARGPTCDDSRRLRPVKS